MSNGTMNQNVESAVKTAALRKLRAKVDNKTCFDCPVSAAVRALHTLDVLCILLSFSLHINNSLVHPT